MSANDLTGSILKDSEIGDITRNDEMYA